MNSFGDVCDDLIDSGFWFRWANFILGKYMKINSLLILSSIAAIGHNAYAGECSRYERDKAQTFAERAASKIVDKFLGGRDIRVGLRECEFNSYDSRFRTKIEIYWNGVIIRDNQYNVDGGLNFSSDGSDAKFSQTYANGNVKDLQFWGTMAGVALVLGELGSSSAGNGGGQAQGFVSQGGATAKVFFDNSCKRPVKMALRYKDDSDVWRTGGWWNFRPYTRTGLTDGGNSNREVRTRSSIIYYFAETTDGSNLIWRGDEMYRFDERSLGMRKVVDERGDRTEIQITCPD